MKKNNYYIFIFFLILQCGFDSSNNVRDSENTHSDNKHFQHTIQTEAPIFVNRDYVQWRSNVLAKFYWKIHTREDTMEEYMLNQRNKSMVIRYLQSHTLRPKRYSIYTAKFDRMNVDSWRQFFTSSFKVSEKFRASLNSSKKYEIYYDEFLELFKKIIFGASENIYVITPLVNALLDNIEHTGFQNELISNFRNCPELLFEIARKLIAKFSYYQEYEIKNYKKNFLRLKSLPQNSGTHRLYKLQKVATYLFLELVDHVESLKDDNKLKQRFLSFFKNDMRGYVMLDIKKYRLGNGLKKSVLDFLFKHNLTKTILDTLHYDPETKFDDDKIQNLSNTIKLLYRDNYIRKKYNEIKFHTTESNLNLLLKGINHWLRNNEIRNPIQPHTNLYTNPLSQQLGNNSENILEIDLEYKDDKKVNPEFNSNLDELMALINLKKNLRLRSITIDGHYDNIRIKELLEFLLKPDNIKHLKKIGFKNCILDSNNIKLLINLLRSSKLTSLTIHQDRISHFSELTKAICASSITSLEILSDLREKDKYLDQLINKRPPVLKTLNWLPKNLNRYDSKKIFKKLINYNLDLKSIALPTCILNDEELLWEFIKILRSRKNIKEKSSDISDQKEDIESDDESDDDDFHEEVEQKEGRDEKNEDILPKFHNLEKIKFIETCPQIDEAEDTDLYYNILPAIKEFCKSLDLKVGVISKRQKIIKKNTFPCLHMTIPVKNNRLVWPKYPKWKRTVEDKNSVVASYISKPDNIQKWNPRNFRENLTINFPENKEYVLDLSTLPKVDSITLKIDDKNTELRLTGSKALRNLTINSEGNVIFDKNSHFIIHHLKGCIATLFLEKNSILYCLNGCIYTQFYTSKGMHIQIGKLEIYPIYTGKGSSAIFKGTTQIYGDSKIGKKNKKYNIVSFKKDSTLQGKNNSIDINAEKIFVRSILLGGKLTIYGNTLKLKPNCKIQINDFNGKLDNILFESRSRVNVQKCNLYAKENIHIEKNSTIDTRYGDEVENLEKNENHILLKAKNITINGNIIAHRLSTLAKEKLKIQKYAQIINPTKKDLVPLHYLKREGNICCYDIESNYADIPEYIKNFQAKRRALLGVQSSHHRMISNYFDLSKHPYVFNNEVMLLTERNKNFHQLMAHHFNAPNITVNGKIQSNALTIFEAQKIDTKESFEMNNFYTLMHSCYGIGLWGKGFSNYLQLQGDLVGFCKDSDFMAHHCKIHAHLFSLGYKSKLRTIEYGPYTRFEEEEIIIKAGEICTKSHLRANKIIVKNGGMIRASGDIIDIMDKRPVMQFLLIETNELILEPGARIECANLTVQRKTSKKNPDPIQNSINIAEESKILCSHNCSFKIPNGNITINGDMKCQGLYICSKNLNIGPTANIKIKPIYGPPEAVLFVDTINAPPSFKYVKSKHIRHSMKQTSRDKLFKTSYLHLDYEEEAKINGVLETQGYFKQRENDKDLTIDVYGKFRQQNSDLSVQKIIQLGEWIINNSGTIKVVIDKLYPNAKRLWQNVAYNFGQATIQGIMELYNCRWDGSELLLNHSNSLVKAIKGNNFDVDTIFLEKGKMEMLALEDGRSDQVNISGGSLNIKNCSVDITNNTQHNGHFRIKRSDSNSNDSGDSAPPSNGKVTINNCLITGGELNIENSPLVSITNDNQYGGSSSVVNSTIKTINKYISGGISSISDSKYTGENLYLYGGSSSIVGSHVTLQNYCQNNGYSYVYGNNFTTNNYSQYGGTSYFNQNHFTTDNFNQYGGTIDFLTNKITVRNGINSYNGTLNMTENEVEVIRGGINLTNTTTFLEKNNIKSLNFHQSGGKLTSDTNYIELRDGDLTTDRASFTKTTFKNAGNWNQNGTTDLNGDNYFQLSNDYNSRGDINTSGVNLVENKGDTNLYKDIKFDSGTLSIESEGRIWMAGDKKIKTSGSDNKFILNGAEIDCNWDTLDMKGDLGFGLTGKINDIEKLLEALHQEDHKYEGDEEWHRRDLLSRGIPSYSRHSDDDNYATIPYLTGCKPRKNSQKNFQNLLEDNSGNYLDYLLDSNEHQNLEKNIFKKRHKNSKTGNINVSQVFIDHKGGIDRDKICNNYRFDLKNGLSLKAKNWEGMGGIWKNTGSINLESESKFDLARNTKLFSQDSNITIISKEDLNLNNAKIESKEGSFFQSRDGSIFGKECEIIQSVKRQKGFKDWIGYNEEEGIDSKEAIIFKAYNDVSLEDCNLNAQYTFTEAENGRILLIGDTNIFSAGNVFKSPNNELALITKQEPNVTSHHNDDITIDMEDGEDCPHETTIIYDLVKKPKIHGEFFNSGEVQGMTTDAGVFSGQSTSIISTADIEVIPIKTKKDTWKTFFGKTSHNTKTTYQGLEFNCDNTYIEAKGKIVNLPATKFRAYTHDGLPNVEIIGRKGKLEAPQVEERNIVIIDRWRFKPEKLAFGRDRSVETTFQKYPDPEYRNNNFGKFEIDFEQEFKQANAYNINAIKGSFKTPNHIIEGGRYEVENFKHSSSLDFGANIFTDSLTNYTYNESTVVMSENNIRDLTTQINSLKLKNATLDTKKLSGKIDNIDISTEYSYDSHNDLTETMGLSFGPDAGFHDDKYIKANSGFTAQNANEFSSNTATITNSFLGDILRKKIKHVDEIEENEGYTKGCSLGIKLGLGVDLKAGDGRETSVGVGCSFFGGNFVPLPIPIPSVSVSHKNWSVSLGMGPDYIPNLSFGYDNFKFGLSRNGPSLGYGVWNISSNSIDIGPWSINRDMFSNQHENMQEFHENISLPDLQQKLTLSLIDNNEILSSFSSQSQYISSLENSLRDLVKNNFNEPSLNHNFFENHNQQHNGNNKSAIARWNNKSLSTEDANHENIISYAIPTDEYKGMQLIDILNRQKNKSLIADHQNNDINPREVLIEGSPILQKDIIDIIGSLPKDNGDVAQNSNYLKIALAVASEIPPIFAEAYKLIYKESPIFSLPVSWEEQKWNMAAIGTTVASVLLAKYKLPAMALTGLMLGLYTSKIPEIIEASRHYTKMNDSEKSQLLVAGLPLAGVFSAARKQPKKIVLDIKRSKEYHTLQEIIDAPNPRKFIQKYESKNNKLNPNSHHVNKKFYRKYGIPENDLRFKDTNVIVPKKTINIIKASIDQCQGKKDFNSQLYGKQLIKSIYEGLSEINLKKIDRETTISKDGWRIQLKPTGKNNVEISQILTLPPYKSLSFYDNSLPIYRRGIPTYGKLTEAEKHFTTVLRDVEPSYKFHPHSSSNIGVRLAKNNSGFRNSNFDHVKNLTLIDAHNFERRINLKIMRRELLLSFEDPQTLKKIQSLESYSFVDINSANGNIKFITNHKNELSFSFAPNKSIQKSIKRHQKKNFIVKKLLPEKERRWFNNSMKLVEKINKNPNADCADFVQGHISKKMQDNIQLFLRDKEIDKLFFTLIHNYVSHDLPQTKYRRWVASPRLVDDKHRIIKFQIVQELIDLSHPLFGRLNFFHYQRKYNGVLKDHFSSISPTTFYDRLYRSALFSHIHELSKELTKTPQNIAFLKSLKIGDKMRINYKGMNVNIIREKSTLFIEFLGFPSLDKRIENYARKNNPFIKELLDNLNDNYKGKSFQDLNDIVKPLLERFPNGSFKPRKNIKTHKFHVPEHSPISSNLEPFSREKIIASVANKFGINLQTSENHPNHFITRGPDYIDISNPHAKTSTIANKIRFNFKDPKKISSELSHEIQYDTTIKDIYSVLFKFHSDIKRLTNQEALSNIKSLTKEVSVYKSRNWEYEITRSSIAEFDIHSIKRRRYINRLKYGLSNEFFNRVQEVDISKLHFLHKVPRTGKPEDYLYRLTTDFKENGFRVENYVSVLKLPNGKLVMQDGHHRAYAMKFANKSLHGNSGTIPARITNWDDLTGSERARLLLNPFWGEKLGKYLME